MLEAAGVVPGLAVLPSPAQRRLGEEPATLHPGEPFRLEPRAVRDVEAAVGVEERRNVAVRDDVAAVAEEERHLRPIGRRHEHLLGDVVVRVPRERRALDLADRAVGHPDSEHDRRRHEGRERQEELVVVTAAGQRHDRADPGQRDIPGVAPVELEGRETAVGMVKVGDRETVADDADLLEGLVGLRDDLPDRRRVVDVDGDHAAERSVEVGEQVERPADRRDVLVVGVGLVEDRPHDRALDAAGKVRDVDPALGVGAAPDRDHEQPAVGGDLGLEAPLRLLGGREHERVVGRVGAQPVVADLHVVVRRVVRGVGRRLRVAAVEEAGVVVGPRGGRELAPLDAVRQLLAGVDAADPPAAPVRAGVAQGEGDELAALRDGHGREGGRALVAQGVGVEQDGAFRVGRVRRPEDVLVLESGVAELEPAVAAAPRSADAGVVPELGQAGSDGCSIRMPVEDRRGQLVLGGDPGARLRRVAVLERPVRVGDRRAVIVVDLVRGRGRGVAGPGHGRPWYGTWVVERAVPARDGRPDMA